MQRSVPSARPRRLILVLALLILVSLLAVTVVLFRVRSSNEPPPNPASPTSAETVAPSPAMSSSREAPPAPAGPPGQWRSTFADEFNGDSLDLTKWRPNRSGQDKADRPFNTDKEAAAFTPGNVSVRDGELVFTLKAEPTTVEGVQYPLTSGTVSTHGKYDLLDGQYVEARIWIPRGDGLWPAFWSFTEKSWPPEMDGVEFFDTAKQTNPRANYHYPNGQQSGPTAYGDPKVDYRGSWHTYGWLRKDNTFTPYLDGVAYPHAGAEGVDRRNYFIILNLSVYRDRRPQVGPGPTEMRVDWVRAWGPS
jgi:beta-glucanase (GH16 family)